VNTMRSIGKTIAIVGGGFSGTVLAVNLLRHASEQATRIVLIEPRSELGRGVAYQDDDYPHLLNVPASRMSAQSDEPMQFARFAQRQDCACQAEQYLPRRLYGEYLRQLLQQAVEYAAPHMSLEHIRARANSIYRINPTGPYLVSLSNQHRILADDVVLACGYPPPANPAGTASIASHPAYICDPHGQKLKHCCSSDPVSQWRMSRCAPQR
jgi:uncharacterized NAD(P)/FAD-binding protein YdhS